MLMLNSISSGRFYHVFPEQIRLRQIIVKLGRRIKIGISSKWAIQRQHAFSLDIARNNAKFGFEPGLKMRGNGYVMS